MPHNQPKSRPCSRVRTNAKATFPAIIAALKGETTVSSGALISISLRNTLAGTELTSPVASDEGGSIRGRDTSTFFESVNALGEVFEVRLIERQLQTSQDERHFESCLEVRFANIALNGANEILFVPGDGVCLRVSVCKSVTAIATAAHYTEP